MVVLLDQTFFIVIPENLHKETGFIISLKGINFFLSGVFDIDQWSFCVNRLRTKATFADIDYPGVDPPMDILVTSWQDLGKNLS